MKNIAIIICTAVAALVGGDAAFAQAVFLPGGSQFNPPLPAPPPPPKIEPPVVPQMDAPLRQDYAPAPHPSFSDRIGRCLDEGAAIGLGPNDRAAYSRSCANR
jgi:hypothetical protein